jgi:hypothetical protein
MFAVSWRPGELTENRERSFSADVRDASLEVSKARWNSSPNSCQGYILPMMR